MREKGVDVLLRAFALMAATVPTARLVVAGDGPARRELEQLRDDLRLTDSVEFTGYLLPSELERRFALAWVQAVPSRWEEPFGNVAVEAQLRATPVVASATGGLREIVRDGESGVLVPRGEVASLAEALLALLRDRERSERLARRGRELAIARYSLAAHVDRLLAIYGDLAAAG